jgi:hypothetical protein
VVVVDVVDVVVAELASVVVVVAVVLGPLLSASTTVEPLGTLTGLRDA